MKITKDQKIEALERIVKAIFGRQESNIEYKKHFKEITEVVVECDIDDAVKQLSNLDIADINYWFFTDERKLSKEESNSWNKPYEGYTVINLTLETQYWKENEKLKEEIKGLKKNKVGSSK